MTQSQLPDGVKFVTATTGTGTLVAGLAITGYRGPTSLVDGATYSYYIAQTGGFEIGQGVYSSSGQTLTRIVEWSSNGNAAIILAGNAAVSIVMRGEDVAARDLSNLSPSAIMKLGPVAKPSLPPSGYIILYVDQASGWLTAIDSQGNTNGMFPAP